MSQMVIIQLVFLPDDGVAQWYTGVRESFILCDLPSHKKRKPVTFNEVCQLLTQTEVNLINMNPTQLKHLISFIWVAFSHSDYRKSK